MPAQIPSTTMHALRRWLPGARWRAFGVLFPLGLALIVVACGSATAPDGRPNPTPRPTVTPAPSVDWRLVASPSLASPPQSALLAIAAISPTDAWAVGQSFAESDGQQTLIVRWDGVTWRIVACPGLDPLNAIA